MRHVLLANTHKEFLHVRQYGKSTFFELLYPTYQLLP